VQSTADLFHHFWKDGFACTDYHSQLIAVVVIAFAATVFYLERLEAEEKTTHMPPSLQLPTGQRTASVLWVSRASKNRCTTR
jgi:hypothetical protein